MGVWASFFFSRPITQLEAYKKLLKNDKEIREVQASIDELKKYESDKQNED